MPSADTITTVAIAGATGKLGRLIARHLLYHQNVQVNAVTRDVDHLPEDLKNHKRLRVFQCDLNEPESIRPAVKNCSIMISTILATPSEELSTQKAMIDACIAEGVPRFMPNDFTLDWRSANLELMPQKKTNKSLCDYLDDRADKIQHVHLLVGGLLETMFNFRYWCPSNKCPSAGMYYWGTGNEIWEVTSYDNAAQYAAAIALDPQATGFIKVLSDRVNIKEIARTLEDVYGLGEIPLTRMGSLDDLESIVRRGMEENLESEDFWAWRGQSHILHLTNGTGYLQAPLDNGRYADSVEQETLEMWLEDRHLRNLNRRDKYGCQI